MGELSKATMDQGQPHQVALPAYRCLGHNYLTKRFFCEGERLSLCTPCHSYRENDVQYAGAQTSRSVMKT